MLIPIEQRGLDLESLLIPPDGNSARFSLALTFGLGAGLYFEYFRRPQESPTRHISGLNRHLIQRCRIRVAEYASRDPRSTLLSALTENALLFNLDRAPTAALMGMELLAEDLPNFQRTTDWLVSIEAMSAAITDTGSLYRQLYLDFLNEVRTQLPVESLAGELEEIVLEWEGFSTQLGELVQNSSDPETCSRLLRRLAFREEHFWGSVLEFCNRQPTFPSV